MDSVQNKIRYDTPSHHRSAATRWDIVRKIARELQPELRSDDSDSLQPYQIHHHVSPRMATSTLSCGGRTRRLQASVCTLERQCTSTGNGESVLSRRHCDGRRWSKEGLIVYLCQPTDLKAGSGAIRIAYTMDQVLYLVHRLPAVLSDPRLATLEVLAHHYRAFRKAMAWFREARPQTRY